MTIPGAGIAAKAAFRVAKGVAKAASRAARASQGTKGARGFTKSQRKSVRSLKSRLREHKQKLKDYKRNPDAFDNKDFLKNAPNEKIRQQIIDGRIRHLEKEIKNFQKEIDDILNSGGGN